MLQYEVLKHELNEKQAALDELKDALGLERLREEVEMLENKAAEPGFLPLLSNFRAGCIWEH